MTARQPLRIGLSARLMQRVTSIHHQAPTQVNGESSHGW